MYSGHFMCQIRTKTMKIMLLTPILFYSIAIPIPQKNVKVNNQMDFNSSLHFPNAFNHPSMPN